MSSLRNIFRSLTGTMLILLCIMLFSCKSTGEDYTRGIGIYPGNPDEDFSPELKPDQESYRNLARLRRAWHSSSYDYNLTAQLVTDGIIATEMPAILLLETHAGTVPKNEREWVLNHVSGSGLSIDGSDAWLKLGLEGWEPLPEVTRIVLNGSVIYDEEKREGYLFVVSGSMDGSAWMELARSSGPGLPGFTRGNPFAGRASNESDTARPRFDFFADFMGPRDPGEPQPSFSFSFGERPPRRNLHEVLSWEEPAGYRYYRVSLQAPAAVTWTLGELEFYSGDEQIELAPSNRFRSAWMSAGEGEEWVSVDLGSPSTFDRVVLHWVRQHAGGTIQVSDDGRDWRDLARVPEGADRRQEVALDGDSGGRYVRLLLNGDGAYGRAVLSEMEVIGRGGLVPVPRPASAATAEKIPLSGGNWNIQRAPAVNAGGEAISIPGFNSDDWLVATVPGTALVSYLNAGAIPDPDYADNQLMISESFFNSDFWYRNEFEVPQAFAGNRFFLHFDGINWKAEIYLNGSFLGNIEGAFIRGDFDITDQLRRGEANALAVRIIKNAHPGCVKEQTALSPDRNGGILGADNPTYHASVGWDWIPTIRGRNIGIWNDVCLTATGKVTLEDPFVSADLPLPDTTAADVRLEVTLNNHSEEPVSGVLSGTYGEVGFSQEVTLSGNQTKRVQLDPQTHPSLRLDKPRLWWPNGYGAQNLYEVTLRFTDQKGIVSDEKQFMSGVREMSYRVIDRVLNIYVNGRRFIGQGGNWGFPESNLRYRGREYDVAVAYHADMNFTMIRNWVGQTGDDEFYEACDRHGIMVWQDFWLANPADGPDPYDPGMFLENAEDMIRRVRNHPSMAIYVGRNEGNPPEVLDTSLRALVNELHPGLEYISNSSMGVVSGGGPYRALPVQDYFLLYGRHKLHSERGMPNVMTYESLSRTLPESKLWPQNSMWGLHDYCLEGAQGAASFNEMVETAFGEAGDARTFTEWAQWINYDGYRGMFEGRSKFRKGLLLWMSHSAWPSMVWQTYDYYFEPTAAYFGCKKACEPLHIQWNPVWDSVEVVNYSAGTLEGLTARARLINMDGSVQWEQEVLLDSHEDTTLKPFKLEFPASLSAVHFVKLILEKEGKIVSENFYWRGLEEGNYRALKELPEVRLNVISTAKRRGDTWFLETILQNNTKVPALMIRLNIRGNKTGEQLLPALYSDNYMSLLPGESRTITMQVKSADARGMRPEVQVSGFNLTQQ